MVDESFHLTPLDVRRYDFGTALRGYDKSRVDQFRDQVADELERLTRVAQDFESKAKGFHEQLRAFRERDKALNDALVSAQQLRADTREQAEREATLVIREARAEAERMLEDARAEIRRLQNEVDALERTRRSFVAQMRSLAQRQLTDIEAAEQTGAMYAASLAGAATVAPVTPAGGMPVINTASEPADEPPSAPPPTARPSKRSSPVVMRAVVADPNAAANASETRATEDAALDAPRDAGSSAPRDAGGSAAPDADIPDTRAVPVLPPEARTDRKSSRDTRTPTWLDSSVPE